MKKNLLSVAVKGAIGLTAAAVMVPTMPAFAQDAEMVEEVVVTGSRIKRADLDSSSPVTVLSAEDMQATGITDVGDLLQRLPAMSGSPIGTTTNNGGNGSVQVDLRGLGPVRTLTLVNGKRTVDGGDYQTIPAVMIERVEILKDGASAAYGADAVAGVVNVITKKDFEGIKLEVQNSDSFEADAGAQDTVSFIAGKSFDGGNVTFGAEYVKQEEVYQSDTPWDFFQDSYYIYPDGTAFEEGGPTAGLALGSSRIPEGYLETASGAEYMNPGDGLVEYDGRTYNYAPVNYIQTPYERINIFAEANFDLTENTRFYSEFRANLRESAQELAPNPYNSPTDPAYSGVDPGAGAFNGISVDNYYNTTGENIIDARRRIVESDRRFEQDIVQFQAVAGLQGSIKDWDWDMSYNKGFRERGDADYGQFYGPNLSKALGPSADLDGDGTPECYSDINDPSSLIAGCVPMDMFGGAGSITPEMLAYAGTTVVDTYAFDQDQFNASITGDLFQMPAGAVGAAFGYEYRNESLVYRPDSAKVADEVTGNTGAGTEGGYNVNSVFTEFFAPLYDNGSQAVDMTLGLRWDDYSTFGADSVYQVGIEAQIVEGVKFRATQGEVFRAPNISELYAGQVDSFPSYSDPCTPDASGNIAPGCAQSVPQGDTQVLARVGGNPDLEAETGDTLTAGFVLTPALPVGDLSVTLDYWKTEMDNLITSLGAQYILDDCYQSGNSAACDLVTRRSDYTVAQVVDAGLNAASLSAEGIDTEVRYGIDTDVGRFETSVLWVHQLENSRIAFEGADPEEQVGTMASNGEIYAEDKINYSIDWYWNDLSISYLGEYIGEIDAPASYSDYTQKVDAQLYHDLAAAYTFPTQTRVALGVTNATNEAPPYIDFGFNASTDPSTYRLFGRSYYLRVSQEF